MRFDFVDHFMIIDGLKIRYWDEGQGTPLLLIHGMGACVETWAWNIEALATKHRVVAPDIPGSGKSSIPTRDDFFSLQYGARLLRQFAEGLGLSSLSVAGNSMGGMLAIELALTYPEMVERLILVDSGGLGKEVHWSVTFMTVPLVNQIFAHPPRALVRQGARALLYRHDEATEELVDKVIAYAQVPGSRTAAVRMARTGVDPWGQTAAYTEAQLGKIRAPTFVIWGKEDYVIPARHAETALRAIPDCRAVVLSEAGHGPQIDRPETFTELVLEFVDQGKLAIEDPTEKRIAYL
jgi:pimeloyl-ACP methyl ester carboxylesterase